MLNPAVQINTSCEFSEGKMGTTGEGQKVRWHITFLAMEEKHDMSFPFASHKALITTATD